MLHGAQVDVCSQINTKRIVLTERKVVECQTAGALRD
jgi:hypothetical protein